MKKLVKVLAILCALAVMMTLICACNNGTAVDDGTKNITVIVKYEDATTKEFKISTKSDNLRGALDEISLVSGEESEYGLFIKTVDGVTVDDSKEQWWCVTRGGAAVMTGVESTPIADGEVYEITLTTGY